ncbi:uncharacterized protein L201_000787 [Kwoniella dendrophila CBS 6074]|uniref:Uncharacterized protein n=1 Tax=Kwoniella dendrophila CBS 6074 TaxID=1295534 RepID=A0AAX4JM86_9TREE
MPLQTRRPNLPTLTLPGSKFSSLIVEDVQTPHTPNPFTPLPFEQGPMVMTPDTPSFDMKPLEIILGENSFSSQMANDEKELDWTEEEEGLLQSYLAHPPRALRTAYPPGTLPPPSALDEITTHLITSEARKSPSTNNDNDEFIFTTKSKKNGGDSPSSDEGTPKCVLPRTAWRHSWNSTRLRLFNLARKESIQSIGGHQRKESDSIIPREEEKVDAVMKPSRPRLAVLGGGQKMNRQQHSMDSLYGDEKPQTFQEALRLSSNLQVNAQGENEILHSGSGLSSPLAFSFNLPTTIKKAFPFSAPSTYLPRPSLLQRGRSFTSEDFAREHAKGEEDDVDAFNLDDICDGSRPECDSPIRVIRPEIQRSVSSPVSSTFDSSPPSSISSQCEDHDQIPEGGLLLDVEMAEEDQPITPVNQTFSGLNLGIPNAPGGPLGSQCTTPTVSSTPLNPPPIVQPPSTVSKPTSSRDSITREAPAITLTVNSPEKPCFPFRSISSPYTSSASPSEAFSNLSLNNSSNGNYGSLPLKLPFTTSPMNTRSISIGLGNPSVGGRNKRSLRPAQLNRSLSDSGTSRSSLNSTYCGGLGGLSMTSLSSERDRENKRQKAIANLKFGGNGLSVIVPKRNGLLEELRSPFEIKKAF